MEATAGERTRDGCVSLVSDLEAAGRKERDNGEIYFPFLKVMFIDCYLYLTFMETGFFLISANQLLL